MSSSSYSSSALPVRYARALIDVAEEGKVLSKVKDDLRELSAMIETSADLSDLMCRPTVSKAAQSNVFAALAKKEKWQGVTANFIGVISYNGRLRILRDIINSFFVELERREGRVAVQVKTAHKLTAKQQKDIENTLSDAVGHGVVLDSRVDPALIGGMVVTIGSHMIDGSVAGKLERLRLAMSASSNENNKQSVSKVEEVA